MTAPTVAVKVAVFSPVAKDTNPGTVTFALLLESKTLAPAPGQAGTVTVQVDVPGAFTVAGEHVNDVTCVAWTRLMDVDTVEPLHVAVTDAEALDCSVPVVATKVADACPAEIAMLAGTVRAVLLLLIKIWAALAAGLFRETVQVLVPLLARLEGAQETDDNAVGTIALSVTLADPPFVIAASSAV